MDSAVHRRRSIFLCVIVSGCLVVLPAVRSCFLHAQQTPEQEDSLDAQSQQVSPVTETDVLLDRRIDRDKKTINFTYPYETTLEPADIHIGERQHMEQTGYASTISLTGILQRINLDKDTYCQGEIARLHITALAPLQQAEITFLWRRYDLYPVDTTTNMYTTVLGVPMTADTGQYTMTLKYQEILL